MHRPWGRADSKRTSFLLHPKAKCLEAVPSYSSAISDSMENTSTELDSLTLKSRTKEENQIQMQTDVIVIKYETEKNLTKQP